MIHAALCVAKGVLEVDTLTFQYECRKKAFADFC